MSKSDPRIVVKNYEHLNRAMPNWDTPKGKHISSRKQYEEEIRRAGLTKYKEPVNQPYKKLKANPETIKFLNSLNPDKKGKVKLSDRQIDYMIKKGAIKDRDKYNKYIPKDYSEKGGFK